jgi:predicted RNA-binding Zn-ribbon protein involved in translation (DUF1610 family)
MGFFENLGTVFDSFINPEEYKDIGTSGERFTYRKLIDLYPKRQIFRNLYIRKANGAYTEIDLLSVGLTCVISYESKNYSGWIFGKDTDKEWVQSLPNGSKKRFHNPIWQNKTHIEALKEYLKDYPILEYHSIIVFSERCTLKKIECNTPNTHVIKRDNLERTVNGIRKNVKPKLSDAELNEILSLLQKAQRPAEEIRKQHLEDLQDMFSKCPKCGSELVERTAKSTGEKFYGCKAFPKCKYTTKEIKQVQ